MLRGKRSRVPISFSAHLVIMLPRRSGTLKQNLACNRNNISSALTSILSTGIGWLRPCAPHQWLVNFERSTMSFFDKAQALLIAHCSRLQWRQQSFFELPPQIPSPTLSSTQSQSHLSTRPLAVSLIFEELFLIR
jgi:hypothetical protein